ncbi:MAG: T9SS type A sorting domain-containing protein, partial [Bacteroidota bacterium]
LQALIAPEMPRQIRRWGLPESLEEWRQTVEDMRIFALRRPFELQRILQHDLGIPIRLGPNPGQDQLNVYLPAPTFLPGEVRVMDISGRVYLSWEGDWETDQVQLQTTSLKPGYYWVQVFDGYRRWTLPWIKSVQ